MCRTWTRHVTPSSSHKLALRKYAQTNQVKEIQFNGTITGNEIRAYLLLPKSYAENPTRRYPLVTYLHGRGGREDAIAFFTGYGRETIGRQICLLYASGIVDDVIYLIPDGVSHLWIDTYDKKTSMLETNVVKELIPYVDDNFRTIATPETRLVMGFSMGGYGALLYGTRHPDVFGRVLARSAGRWPSNLNWQRLNGRAVREKANSGKKDAWKPRSPWRLASFLMGPNIYNNARHYRTLDIVEIVRQQARVGGLDKSRIWIFSGADDGGSATQMKSLAEAVKKAGLKDVRFRVVEGCGHGLDACMDGGRKEPGQLAGLQMLALLRNAFRSTKSWERMKESVPAHVTRRSIDIAPKLNRTAVELSRTRHGDVWLLHEFGIANADIGQRALGQAVKHLGRHAVEHPHAARRGRHPRKPA